MEKQTHTVGERVEKFCAICQEERGHVVASVTKRGQISRVSCPKCGTRSTFKSSTSAAQQGLRAKTGAPYDPKLTYRTGAINVASVFRTRGGDGCDRTAED